MSPTGRKRAELYGCVGAFGCVYHCEGQGEKSRRLGGEDGTGAPQDGVELQLVKRSRLLALLILAFTFSASAQAPVLTANLVGRSDFPTNEHRDIFHFDGCVDCSGPWLVSSSDYLGPMDGARYSADKLADNNFLTCWAVQGGVGSWFALSSGEGRQARYAVIRGFSIVNGYAKSPGRWAQNARIKTLELSVAGKTLATIRLHDSPAVQSVELPEFILKGGEELRITVRSVYPGSSFDDLCVSEFQLNTKH